MSRLFVLPHEAAIAEDIGTEYCGELTFQNPPPSATDNRASPVDCQRAGSSNQTRPNPSLNYEGSGFREPLCRLTAEMPLLSRTRTECRAPLLVTGLVRRATCQPHRVGQRRALLPIGAREWCCRQSGRHSKISRQGRYDCDSGTNVIAPDSSTSRT